MIHDTQLLFSDAQALTATAVSTNVVDLGIARDIGTGDPLYLVVILDVALTDAGSDSTIAVTLQGGATAGATTASQVLFTIPAVATAGSIFVSRLSPAGLSAARALTTTNPLSYRFIQLTYTVANGNLTTGTVTAFVTTNIEQLPTYATGITIA